MNSERIIESADKKVKETADRAYDTVDAARKEAKRIAEEAYARGEDGIDEARETVEKFWNRTKRASQQVERRVNQYSKEGWSAFRRFAKERPAQTVLIALAVGTVVGAALFAGATSDED